jgi:hypothetical protein
MLVTLTLYLEDNIRLGSPGGRGPGGLVLGLVESIVLSVLTVESSGTGRKEWAFTLIPYVHMALKHLGTTTRK